MLHLRLSGDEIFLLELGAKVIHGRSSTPSTGLESWRTGKLLGPLVEQRKKVVQARIFGGFFLGTAVLGTLSEVG